MVINMRFKLTEEQLAESLLNSITDRLGLVVASKNEMDWATKRNVIYIGPTEVSKDANVAVLVNAYNILKFGKSKRFK